jgi:hypothetical protein
VVNTSEFNEVRGRLAMLHNRQKIDTDKDANRPRLRRAPGASAGPTDEAGDDAKQKPDPDERPTLKRRDQ